MPTSVTGSSGVPRNVGFSLVELMVVMAIAGLVMAVAVPASVRFYDSMQTRQAVRDAITLLSSARQLAVNRGVAQDVVIDPRRSTLALNDTVREMPGDLRLTVHGAAEVNRQDAGVIRFYPEGGSSGGGLDIDNPGGGRVSIAVDWLVGRVSHETQ
ncbi:MAG: Tfp pilus assembly protein FimT/FimU [Chromatocurvus sp.]